MGLIWIQTILQSDGIPERIFKKLKKNQQMAKNHEKSSSYTHSTGTLYLQCVGQKIQGTCTSKRIPVWPSLVKGLIFRGKKENSGGMFISIQCFPQVPVASSITCSQQFHLLIGVKEPATLVQNAVIPQIFLNETLTINANVLTTTTVFLKLEILYVSIKRCA